MIVTIAGPVSFAGWLLVGLPATLLFPQLRNLRTIGTVFAGAPLGSVAFGFLLAWDSHRRNVSWQLIARQMVYEREIPALWGTSVFIAVLALLMYQRLLRRLPRVSHDIP